MSLILMMCMYANMTECDYQVLEPNLMNLEHCQKMITIYEPEIRNRVKFYRFLCY